MENKKQKILFSSVLFEHFQNNEQRETASIVLVVDSMVNISELVDRLNVWKSTVSRYSFDLVMSLDEPIVIRVQLMKKTFQLMTCSFT